MTVNDVETIDKAVLILLKSRGMHVLGLTSL